MTKLQVRRRIATYVSRDGLRLTAWLVLLVALMDSARFHVTATRQDGGDTPFVHPHVPLEGGVTLNFLRRKWLIAQTAADRLRRFPDSPNTLAWLSQAERLDDALGVLERIVQQFPERMVEAFDAVESWKLRSDEMRGYKARARRILSDARRKQPALDPETQAKLAVAMVPLEVVVDDRPGARDERLRAVVEAHAGTEAARLAEVDLALDGRVTWEALARLEALAAKHPGTIVAAKARYLRAFHLARNGSSLDPGPDVDPTERFLEVVAIVEDLESGRYPASRWVTEAPELVTQFSLIRPAIAPTNAPRMIEVFRRFMRQHLTMLRDARGDDSLEFLLTHQIPAVASFLPDGAAAVDRLFTEYEREWPDAAAARYLKARWRLRAGDAPLGVGPAAAPTFERDLKAILASAASANDGPHAQAALNLLAELELGDPKTLSNALGHYREYVRRFGRVEWRWLGPLRVGQVEHALGRHADAAATFSEVARSAALDPFARVLGRAYAGRASEAAGLFPDALAHYQAAIAAWDPEMGSPLSLDVPMPPPPPGSEFSPRPNAATVVRTELEARVNEMTRSLALENGAEIERARWLLAQGRPNESRLLLQSLRFTRATSAESTEAQMLLKRARLDSALALADSSNRGANVAAALDQLAVLSRESFDATTALAGIARASLLHLSGKRLEAAAAIRAVMATWVTESTRLSNPPPPAGSLEHDVLSIRDAVLRPLGGGIFSGARSDFAWPNTLPEFVVAPAHLRVIRPGHKEPTHVAVATQPSTISNVVFIAEDDLRALHRLPIQLGGTKVRQPQRVMEVPNQPVGDSLAIVEFWNRFFFARPGHWGGWLTLTPPSFAVIEFLDAERTRAAVPVRFLYSGATVVLAKQAGAWVPKQLTASWIE